jgi:hypothetical protein
MTLVRAIFSVVLAMSLAALPARLGAIAISASSSAAVSSIAECTSPPCEPTPGMPVATMDMMPMPGGCDQPGGHGTTLPGACSTYCNSLPILPTIVFAAVNIVFIHSMTPALGTIMDGVGVSLEPHPPKLV